MLNRAFKKFTAGQARITRYYFIAQPLDVRLPVPRRLHSVFDARMISEEESAGVPFPRPSSVIRSRYKQGSLCLGVFKDEELAGYIWLVVGAYDEDDVRCRYVPYPTGVACWDYDLYVAEKFRNSAVYSMIWTSAIAVLTKSGVRWSLSRVSGSNPKSLAAHLRMGAVRIGTAFFLQFGATQITLSSTSPYLHLSRDPDRRPSFALRPPRERQKRTA
jgi:hypothetical protein